MARAQDPKNATPEQIAGWQSEFEQLQNKPRPATAFVYFYRERWAVPSRGYLFPGVQSEVEPVVLLDRDDLNGLRAAVENVFATAPEPIPPEVAKDRKRSALCVPIAYGESTAAGLFTAGRLFQIDRFENQTILSEIARGPRGFVNPLWTASVEDAVHEMSQRVGSGR